MKGEVWAALGAAWLVAASPAQAAEGLGVADAALPERWSSGTGDEVSSAPWWERLGDPGLARAIEAALAGNLDLAVATDRLDQARALAVQALAPLMPTASFDYSISGETDDVRAGRTGFLTTDALPDFVYSGSGQITAGLEIDLFGRNALGYQAARDDLAASKGDRASIAGTVATRVASAWFDVGLHSERLSALEAQLAAAREVLELTRIRQARAEATAVDVLQQEQAIASIEAQIPLVKLARRLAAQQLAVLCGRAPDAPPADLPARMPALPDRGGLGAPDDLAAHRADVRAAAERLDAAWHRRMARERAFLPKLRGSFNLTGSYSNTQKISFGVTGATVEYGSVYGWTVGGSLSWPLFDGGASIGALQQARAAERAAAHTLTQAELNAAAEVEGAIAQDEAQVERAQAVDRQATAARAAFDVARERYATGVGDYLTVLNTLNAHRTAELALLQARRDALSARVALQQALGGDWTRALETPSDL